MNKRIGFTSILAFAGLIAAGTPASAEEVLFTTSGIFTSTGTNVITNTSGGKTSSVTFNGNPTGDDFTTAPGVTPATVDTLGEFTVSLPAGTSLTGAGDFIITINQSSPAGNGNLGTDSLAGKVTNAGGVTGSLLLTFQNTSVTIGGITYTLEDLGQNGLAPDQLAIGKNGAAIEAAITSATPEPTFFALTGLGFLGLATIAGRRYKKQVPATNV
jgi:hypothetical protein